MLVFPEVAINSVTPGYFQAPRHIFARRIQEPRGIDTYSLRIRHANWSTPPRAALAVDSQGRPACKNSAPASFLRAIAFDHKEDRVACTVLNDPTRRVRTVPLRNICLSSFLETAESDSQDKWQVPACCVCISCTAFTVKPCWPPVKESCRRSDALQLVLDGLQETRVEQTFAVQPQPSSAVLAGPAESQAYLPRPQATTSTSCYRQPQSQSMPHAVPKAGSFANSDSFQQWRHQVKILPGQQVSIDLDKNISRSAFTQAMRWIQSGVHVSFNVTVDEADRSQSGHMEDKSSRERKARRYFEDQLVFHRRSVKPDI